LNGTSSVLYGTVADFVRSERQSRAFGLFYTLGSSAGAVSPLVFGLVSDSLGVATTLFLNSLLAIGTIPLAFLLGPHVAARTPASMESN
jgi:MFS family permease